MCILMKKTSYNKLLWKFYLMFNLLLLECDQDACNEEIEHYKCHEHDAGANEQSTNYRVVFKNLTREKKQPQCKKHQTDSLMWMNKL